MRERVNPRVNRDLPTQEPPPDTRSEFPERTLALVDVTTSAGWEEIVVTNLKHRCRSIERHLAVSRGIEPAELARLQAHHDLMQQVIADPKAFFTSDPHAADGPPRPES
jgi:hypothetical protein